MVDQVANFKKVTVSTGYNNTATSIVLATGQGAELPDPSGDNYNLVWWDSTNYNDPADDPNVEIVRATAKSSDTLTVTRNQESSGASNKNNADATYKMILPTTAKTITDLIAVEKAATVIVGKSGEVDYLTTDYGSDDACIQAAINYVDSVGGGSVLIREGTYTRSAGKIYLKSKLTLCGVGNSTIIKSTITANALEGTSITDVCIRDIQFDQNNQNSTAIAIMTSDRVTLENLYVHDVTGATYYGVYIEDCNFVSIRDSTFKTIGRDAIQLKGCADNVISGCLIDGAGYYGIDCHDSATPVDMYRTSITNCVITNSVRGIDVAAGDDWSISNCIIEHSSNLGIDIRDTVNRLSISNCTIYDSAVSHIDTYNATAITDLVINGCVFDTNVSASKDGVFLKNITDGVISNCIVKNNTRHGIYVLSPISIFGCIANDNGLNGIYLEGSNCLIAGNVCDNNDRGIREYTGHDNNIITNNITLNNSTNPILTVGANTIAKDNVGYNPVGAVGPPGVPNTTVNYTNVYGYPCQVQVYGGTVTEIDIDDIATGLTAGVFMIPPSGTINITYSAAPSWRWWGL